MKNNKSMFLYDLNVVIVKYGMGSKVLAFAKECGIMGGTVLLGRGTVRNSLLRFLELAESHKEIILIMSSRDLGSAFLEKANVHFHFDKPNHGIGFSLPLSNIIGTHSCVSIVEEIDESEGEGKVSYNSIIVVVEKGKAEQVVDAANEAGARGATIINARGSGIHETSKIFAIEIEPEKEMVLILVDRTISDDVCMKIREKIGLDQPGKGVLFVQHVHQMYGLYE